MQLYTLRTTERIPELSVELSKRAVDWQTNAELLYNYLAGPEFRQRVEGMLEPLAAMKNDLQKEMSSVRRLWAKREKQIDRTAAHLAGMYGDLGGIVGAGMPRIAELEMETSEHDEMEAITTVSECA